MRCAVCAAPGRLYAAGWRCDQHRPRHIAYPAGGLLPAGPTARPAATTPTLAEAARPEFAAGPGSLAPCVTCGIATFRRHHGAPLHIDCPAPPTPEGTTTPMTTTNRYACGCDPAAPEIWCDLRHPGAPFGPTDPPLTPDVPGGLAVTCPACPGLDTAAPDEAEAVDAAGTHDDTHHDGQPTAETHPDASPDARLHLARGYATAGWPVFVLGRSKRPVANCQPCKNAGPDHDREGCGCLTCHGFYAATTDPARIAAMLTAVPDGLVAIRTGAASGLVVIDIDPAHGGQLDPALMTPTATVATGGGGWHLYYTHPGQPIPSRPLPGHPGVDVKADGGYVVAPPSTHPATRRRYRWTGGRPVGEMPPPLLAVCLSQPDPPAPATATPHPTSQARPARQGGRGISHPDLLLAAHLAAVARAPEGQRRTTLYGASRGAARMVAADALTCHEAVDALTAAGRAAGQTERETRAAIEGGFRDEAVTLQL